MNYKIKYLFTVSTYFVLSLILCVSCTENNNSNKNFIESQPKVTQSNGIWMNPDSFAKPLSIPAGKPLSIPAGKPKVNPTNLNVHIAGKPNIISAGKPKINTPGTDTFLLPKTIPAIGKVMPAGLPEVVIAKDMVSKDQNPANFSFFKTLQGLKHNNIRCLLQDKTGNIWFATYGGGVSRYDGKNFTNFTEKEGLANNVVISILEDKAGNLWFGTYSGGLSSYNGKNFTNFTEKEGLANNHVSSIIEDKTGNIWFGTNAGVCRYDGKSFLNFSEKEGLSNDVVFGILEDKTGNIWVGTRSGVCYYNGKSFVNFSEKEGLVNNHVKSILEDKTGNIWFGTDGGICYYNGKSFMSFSKKDEVASNMVISIFEDKIGNIWFGTDGFGISYYDGNSFTNFSEKEGLSNDVVFGILEDKTGNIWVGTDGGACRYKGNSFTNFSEKEGLVNNYVNKIIEDRRGKLWFGTSSGASHYDKRSFTNFTEKEGLAYNVVNSILEDKIGNIWFGTEGGGLSCYDGKSFKNFTRKNGLINDFVFSVFEDRSGNIWTGTNGGVSCYDGKSFTNFTKKEGLYNNVVFSILEDKTKNIWFGTYGGGISCYNGKSFTNYTEKEGLVNNVVFSILEDKTGNIWFGTGGGISLYNGKTFTSFSEKDGLINNTVLNISQDKEGNMWFGTRKGLSKITNAMLNKSGSSFTNSINPIKKALFYNYGYNDGFLGLNCRRNSVLQDSKGKIWWGADVLTCYNPEGDIADTTTPVMQINSMKLFGEEIAWSSLKAIYYDSTGREIKKGVSIDTTLGNGVVLHDIKFDGLSKWYSLPEHLSLPYDNNNLTFNFIGIHIQSHNHIKYQYKLEGLEENWSSITERTEAPYGNLPSGKYIFMVKAMNQSGVWSKPFEFEFVVRPPWWQTWWFRILVSILIISSVIFYIKWREQNLKQRQKELEQTVFERTEEVVEQKNEAEKQKKDVEEKQKEIIESITYAKRLQEAILPSRRFIDKFLPNNFILYKPKDLVAGDFYWAERMDDLFFIAAADSTGHGVPGAMVSVVCMNALNRAVKEFGITETGLILDKTRELVLKTFEKSNDEVKDGMDISLLCIDNKNKSIYWSGANNPLWYIQDNELHVIKADKQPIGKAEKYQPFSTHKINYKTDTQFYLFTDGFADQFGGPKGKKFKYKPLSEVLVKNYTLSQTQQLSLLDKTFSDWKGSLEQVDDVCIIGIKI